MNFRTSATKANETLFRSVDQIPRLLFKPVFACHVVMTIFSNAVRAWDVYFVRRGDLDVILALDELVRATHCLRLRTLGVTYLRKDFVVLAQRMQLQNIYIKLNAD